jgi:hypothetical protein
MSAPALIIGGIVIPRYASLSINQDYDLIAPASLLRLGNGDGIVQSSDWGKLKTSIQINGTIPSGLDGIDWQSESGVEIHCVATRAVQSTSNVILLPAARRSDETPVGLAIVGGKPIEVPMTIDGNTATVQITSGATAYRVNYFPRITVHGIPKSQTDESGAAYSFSLDAEEL